MVKTTTQNDLLQYAYNETGLVDSDRIQRSLDGDPILQEEYNELQNVLKTLDAAQPEVPQKCIDAILKFAHS